MSMKRNNTGAGRLAALLLAVVVLASGCTAQNHLRRADAAVQAGDIRAALHHYEQALSHKQSLAQDEDFLTRLAGAQARVAYEDGRALRVQGRLEAAAQKLREALSYDPAFAPPQELLPIVNGQVARERYGRAIASADRAALDAAGEHLRVAQAHDPGNLAVIEALASLRPQTLPASTPGLAAFRRGLALSGERRWDAALGAQREAVTLNPNLLPARAQVAQALEQLAESRRLSDRGAARIRESRISASVPFLEDALAVWPYNEPARSSLAHARGVLTQAEAKLAEAVDAAQAADWDTAIAAADAGILMDKSHPRLRELEPQLSTRAAADYTRRAAGHLEVGDLPGARDDYRKALDYRHPYGPAQHGLAGVYHAMGVQLEADGRPGAALLHYNRGQAYRATPDIAQAQTRALRAIRTALGASVAFETGQTPDGLAVSSARLLEALHTAGQRHERGGLALAHDQSRFVVAADITGARVEQQFAGSETRTHRYTAEEDRPNPRYDDLIEQIDYVQTHLHRLERDYHSHVGRHGRRGRSRGHGHDRDDEDEDEDEGDHDSSHDSRDDDRLRQHLDDLERRIYRKQYELEQLYDELRRTPQDVRVQVPASTTYGVETYRKTGTLTVHVQLIDRTSGEVIQSFTAQGSSTHRDTTIPDPNPDIGLRPDRLTLPADGQVAQEIANDAARSAVSQAVQALATYELDRLRTQATALREVDDDAGALEVETAAGVLLGLVDPGASSRVLERLVEDHTE